MKSVIPINKQSKKAQKAFYAKQRKSWNGLVPVTRIRENGKAYDRKKLKQQAFKNHRRYDDLLHHFFGGLILLRLYNKKYRYVIPGIQTCLF